MKSQRKKQSFSVGRALFSFADLAAALIFIAVAVFFVFNARFGSTEADETLYGVVCYRLSRGDKLFADDWMFLTSAFFQYLPFRFFSWILGGTQGIILALRYFYIALKMVFFIYIYVSLRSYGYWAVLASSVYCGTDLFGMKTMDFYSICMNAALITAFILFVRKNARPWRYAFAGFVFSCAVIVQPGVALVWGIYSATVLAVWLAGKKSRPLFPQYGFILSARVWRFIFAGICAAALLFILLCAAFFTGTDVKMIAEGLRALLQMFGRKTAEGYSLAWIRLNKPVMYAIMYQPVLFVAFILLLIASVFLLRWKNVVEKPLFCVLFTLFMCMSVHLILYPVESTGNTVGEAGSHPLLLSLAGIPIYAYTKDKNRKMFVFLLFSLIVSLSVDIFSNNTFGSVLLPGNVAALMLLRDYTNEKLQQAKEAGISPRTKKHIKTKSRAARAFAGAVVCFAVFIAVFEVWHYSYMCGLPALEARLSGSYGPLDSVVSCGVEKGTVTTRELCDFCEKTERDAQRIRAMGARDLYVADYDVTAYIGAGANVCAPWAQVFQNWEGEELWWALHRYPDVVYIPFSSLSYSGDVASPENRLAYFQKQGDFTVQRGENGYILQRVPAVPAP